MKNLLLLLILAGCATQPYKAPEIIVTAPEVPEVVVTPRRGTPSYTIPETASIEYQKALELIHHHANTDEFWDYVKAKRTYFSHTDATVSDAIKAFREQLGRGDIIEVMFYRPWYKSSAVGGWDGFRITQNTQWHMKPFRRAGHLLHETSHKYGWKHQGNYTDKYDNVNSFPYAVGYDFEEFLEKKYFTQLADK